MSIARGPQDEGRYRIRPSIVRGTVVARREEDARQDDVKIEPQNGCTREGARVPSVIRVIRYLTPALWTEHEPSLAGRPFVVPTSCSRR